METKKQGNAVDLHVGARVRMRRSMIGMSRDKLAEHLGITVQQIQKYEQGTNRIGAGRLADIARVLSSPVSFFFEDAPGATRDEIEGMAEPRWTRHVLAFLGTAQGRQLNQAFVKIRNSTVRRAILDLVRALGDEEERVIRGSWSP